MKLRRRFEAAAGDREDEGSGGHLQGVLSNVVTLDGPVTRAGFCALLGTNGV